MGGYTAREVNDDVSETEIPLFLGLSCPFSLFTLSLSQAEGTRSFGWWWVGLSPTAFGCLRNPLEVLDLNLSFLLFFSTLVVQMGFSPISKDMAEWIEDWIVTLMWIIDAKNGESIWFCWIHLFPHKIKKKKKISSIFINLDLANLFVSPRKSKRKIKIGFNFFMALLNPFVGGQ